MFEITPTALEQLKSYVQENNIDSSIRITLINGGCAGPALGMALDKQGDGDKSYLEDSLEFLIEQDLLTACGDIKVDFIEAGTRSGFAITSTNPIGGGGCGGSCASGSCG